LFPRSRPAHPKRVLIAHHLLVGDVMMLAPLLAKLRERYPQAEVAMTVRRALAPLFARRPYGVQAIPYDPRDSSTLDRLFEAPPFAPFERPSARYVVFHVGAGSPLRLWRPESWRTLAAHFAERGCLIAWSAGPGEERLVEEIDPQRRHLSYAGKLDLAQLWQL